MLPDYARDLERPVRSLSDFLNVVLDGQGVPGASWPSTCNVPITSWEFGKAGRFLVQSLAQVIITTVCTCCNDRCEHQASLVVVLSKLLESFRQVVILACRCSCDRHAVMVVHQTSGCEANVNLCLAPVSVASLWHGHSC